MITFRTDQDTERKLNDLAAELKKTRTEVLREALDLYLEGHRSTTGKKSAKQRTPAIQEFIGVWDGPEDSSIDTGKKFGDHLIASRKARRH